MASLVVILQSITLLATVIGSRSGGCDGGMKKVILSLALGTFGLGMAEFGIMGVLTELAHNVGISIPAAGHMISYYALGVVVGAPIIALFSSRYSLKHILLFLVALCVIGNAMFTLSSSYLMLAIGRLVSGFPHGAFFGVGAIVLSKIIKPGKVTAAVAGMVSGMTVANLLGIPLGTYLSQEFSWRYTFLLIAVFNIAVMASVYFWVPDIRDEAKGKLREQFHFTQPCPVVNFRRYDVWQRRCVCLVQLRKAIHDVYFRFFGNGDDLYYDVSWARDGAGEYAKWQDFRTLFTTAHCSSD